MTATISPSLLIILDGWGHFTNQDDPYNAIAQATTPTWDTLVKTAPYTTLEASGEAVGLPKGQMGNSEVGHITIGAGRIIHQDLSKIDQAIHDNSFNTNKYFADAFTYLKKSNRQLHILGLLSPGGVHSHEDHIHALLKLVSSQGISQCHLHAILDGRDTDPKSAAASLEKTDTLLKKLQLPPTASIMGRYYAMDRDHRYERTELAYQLLTENKAKFSANTALLALEQAYARNETDEFVYPTTITPTTIQEGDVVIFMNFRSDRARQLSYALTDPGFTDFERTVFPKLKTFITLTEYAADLSAVVAFPKEQPKDVLGEVLEKHNLTQCRIAETEKYAHVTFFLNGGREQPFQQEDRCLIPSPKIATYDLQPHMSAIAVTEQLKQLILQQKNSVIICNFANADMVGHTGNLKATITAIEILDQCLQDIITTLKQVNGQALITADHGNAECMYNPDSDQPHTAHTHNVVPLVYVGKQALKWRTDISKPGLKDIAPTLLALLGLPKPEAMTGVSLIAE